MEYEVLVEEMTPCGGAKHSIRSFMDVETDNPEEYVRGIARFPVMDVGRNENGDVVVTTGDGKGYLIRYTFTA